MVQVKRIFGQYRGLRFLGLAILGLLASGANVGVAQPPEPPPETASTTVPAIIFQMHWRPQAQFAGYLMAREKRFFEQEGVKGLQIRWSVAGDRPFEQLVAGQSDFCVGWLADALVEKDQGKPLVHLAQVFQQSSLMLVTWRRSGIDTPRDFTGKLVGLWGGNFDVQAMALFRKYDVRPVLVPQSTSMVPFLRGAVEIASAMHYNEYHKLIEAGVRPEELRTFRLADYGVMFPEDGIYCTEQTRQERAELCAAVVRACRRGWDYALDHEAQTLDVVMRSCRLANARTNRNHQRWMLRSIHDAIRSGPEQKPVPWGLLSEEAYAKLTRLLIDQGLISRSPAFRDFHQPPVPAGSIEE